MNNLIEALKVRGISGSATSSTTGKTNFSINHYVTRNENERAQGTGTSLSISLSGIVISEDKEAHFIAAIDALRELMKEEVDLAVT